MDIDSGWRQDKLKGRRRHGDQCKNWNGIRESNFVELLTEFPEWQTPSTMGISQRLKAISALSASYTNVCALVHEVTQKAFALAGENVDPILFANDFEIEVISSRGKDSLQQAARVYVKDLAMPMLIGVNPPERLAKQKVITNITFYEKSGMHQVDYPVTIK
ncbi:hypothetical protein DFJ58DRAFT_918330 [Suillus subalutaceus]|uniref:uncharacterized protein n=1 Tax=Suillus subalutaceus TaxID=48586 RepID=UPI001B86C05C|nr:uncharacterized protein DFJ58DRAFT_918330 [Suillus subalutaceus]KAG1830679.1 hypothetical protein DFJ58DRAFT_918330 [Suillus subalutaceus]